MSPPSGLLEGQAQAPYPAYFTGYFPTSYANAYYVDTTSGAQDSDTNACTLTQPCATLAHVNTLPMPNGSVVYLKAGSHFYETLTPPASGITYTSYGVGAQPIIDASQPISTSWTQGTGAQAQESQPSGGFASGFETASFTDWTSGPTPVYSSTATLSQSTTFANNGTYSAALTGDGSTNTVILSRAISAWAANSKYWIRVYIYVPVGAINGNTQLRPVTFSSTYSDYLSLNADSSGNLTSAGLVLGGNYITTAAIPNLANATWHYIDVGLKPATAANGGGGEVWVDNQLYLSNYGSVNTAAAAGNTVIQVGNTGDNAVLPAGNVVYFDDFNYNGTNGRAGSAILPGVPTTAWSTPLATNPLGPLFGTNYGIPVSTIALVRNPYDWYWNGSTLYVYGTTNPGTSLSLPTRTYAANLAGVQNITFNNLDFRGAANSVSGGQVNLTGNISGFTMTNSTCEESYAACVEITEGTATIQNVKIGQPGAGNTFQNVGGGGFNLNASYQAANYVGYNNFRMNCLNSNQNSSNLDLEFCGLFKSFSENVNNNGLSQALGGQGTIIEMNTLTSSAPNILPSGWSGSAAGIWPDTVIGYTVRYNTISGTFSSGIRLEKTGYSPVYGNTIFSSRTQPAAEQVSGIDVICSGGQNSYGNQIFNNSIFGRYWGLSAAPAEVGGVSCNFSSNSFTNNVMSGATSGTELYVASPADNTSYGEGGSGNTYTYNNFAEQGACFIMYGVNPESSGCLNAYPAFDTAVGSTTHSIQHDPRFVSPSTGNLSLGAGSPAIGSGTMVTGFYGAGLNLGVQ